MNISNDEANLHQKIFYGFLGFFTLAAGALMYAINS